MTSEVCQLLGDLAVASVELVETPLPPSDRNAIASFDAWYAHSRRWLHLAIATGIAVDARPHEVTAPLLAPLVAAFDGSRRLASMCAAIENRFSNDDRELDFVHGALEWEELCVARSALELVRDLLRGHAFAVKQLDTCRVDACMVLWGPKLFETQLVPAGIPPHHWWWFDDTPPSQRTLRMNAAMSSLLAGVLPDFVPPEFRQLVAEGFTQVGGHVGWQAWAPAGGAVDVTPFHDSTGFECTANSLHVEDYLAPQPGGHRLAPIALACARLLANQLRRWVADPCRIIVNVRPADGTSTLRFHKIREDESWIADDLEGYQDEAVLVLDTV
jgi:hypothetical protein